MRGDGGAGGGGGGGGHLPQRRPVAPHERQEQVSAWRKEKFNNFTKVLRRKLRVIILLKLKAKYLHTPANLRSEKTKHS